MIFMNAPTIRIRSRTEGSRNARVTLRPDQVVVVWESRTPCSTANIMTPTTIETATAIRLGSENILYFPYFHSMI
jgi:hypothetical protein